MKEKYRLKYELPAAAASSSDDSDSRSKNGERCSPSIFNQKIKTIAARKKLSIDETSRAMKEDSDTGKEIFSTT